MKFISTFLIIHILFLSLAPGLGFSMNSSGMKKGKHSCCENSKKEKNDPKDQKDKDCCNDVCNPFMSCCNGSALTSPTVQFSFHLITIAVQKLDLQKQNLSSAYLADAWHPPKNLLIS